MDGLLVIDKPPGPTSHDVVARMRRVLGERRIGHTGTLDPAASGVLPLVLGRATRLARFMSGSRKRYEAVVSFGQATDTYDAEGLPVGERSLAIPSRTQIESALDTFRGTFEQQPPAFSAKKIAGRRSYESARAARVKPQPAGPGLPVPVSVTVHDLAIVALAGDQLTLSIECSAGFYVRSLAHDLGVRLGVGAHLAALRRTASAGLTLDVAITLDVAERSRRRRRGRHRAARAHAVRSGRSLVLSQEGVRSDRPWPGHRTGGCRPGIVGRAGLCSVVRPTGTTHRNRRGGGGARAFASVRCPKVRY